MAILFCYLDVAREFLVVARMLLWCSGRLLECCYCMLLRGCCYGIFGGC